MNLWEAVLIWANVHRTLMTLLVALVLWCLAYGIYFRRIGVRFSNRGKPHSWQIDLVTKSAMRGNKSDANNGRKLM